MRRTNKIAFDSLEAQTRPWIEIDQKSVELGVTDETRTASGWEKAKVAGIKVQFRNDGHSVAILGTPQFAVTEQNFRINSYVLDGHGLCKKGLEDVTPDNLRGITTAVFPGAETPLQEYQIGPTSTIGDVVGCVVYRNGTTVYRTQYVWRLERILNKKTKDGLVDSIGIKELVYLDPQ